MFTVSQNDPRVTTVRMEGIAQGWSQWFLLRSDAHHDNLHANHVLEKRHLDQALEREAGILDFGDLHCAMQGKHDKRSDQNQLRPELRGSDYYDLLTSYNSSFLLPYAKQWVHCSPGNHETAVVEHCGTDLTVRLARELRQAGSPVKVGSYQGWIRFSFVWNKTKRKTVNLHYTHGYGSGGPVTKDLIQANRQLVFLGDVDILVSGHTHDSWEMTQARETLDHNGIPQIHHVTCLKLGTYKDEFSPGRGWSVGKGHGPKPLGAYFLRFYLEDDTIKFEATRTSG